MEGVFVVQLGERRRSAFRPNDRTAIHYYLTPFDLPSKNITTSKGGDESGLPPEHTIAVRRVRFRVAIAENVGKSSHVSMITNKHVSVNAG